MNSGPPDQIDRYKVVQKIGQGGQGSVYLVHDPVRQQHVALKILSPLNRTENASARFLREFHAVSKLRHPGIVTVYEQGFSDNLPFFTMEYIEGQTINRYVSGHRCIEIICELMIQVAESLAYIHSNNIIHRDLKPSNILVDSRGSIHVTDFGLAKVTDLSRELTQAHSVLGTLNYISPEILTGDEIDHRSDLYSFGVILYELLTGKLPFVGETLINLISLHLFSSPAPIEQLLPDICPELKNLCNSLLEKKPWDRPKSAASIVENLRKVTSRIKAPHHEAMELQNSAVKLLHPRFINRISEIQVLVDSVPVGPGQTMKCVLVSGEAGIGKSRLLREARIQSDLRSVRVVRIQASMESDHPFFDLDEFFAQMAHEVKMQPGIFEEWKPVLPELVFFSPYLDLVPVIPADTESKKNISGKLSLETRVNLLLNLLKKILSITPWLIVIDDFHQMDDSSRKLIFRLIESARGKPTDFPCTLWISIRDEYSGLLNELVSVCQNVPGFSFSKVDTGKLCFEDSCKLVASMMGSNREDPAVQMASQLGNGLPILLVETVRNWVANGVLIARDTGWIIDSSNTDPQTLIPPTVAEILQNRLKILPEQTLDTLSWIAICDPEADFQILKTLGGLQDEHLFETLNTLISGRFIEPLSQSDGTEFYKFIHVQMKELVLNLMDSEEVRLRNEQVAEILLTFEDFPNRDLRIARHLEKADRPADAARYWYSGAEKAQTGSNLMTAMDCYRRCNLLLSSLPPGKQKTLVSLRAKNLFFMVSLLMTVGTSQEVSEKIAELEPLINYLPRDLVFSAQLQKINYLTEIGEFTSALEKINKLSGETDPSDHHRHSLICSTRGFLRLYGGKSRDAIADYQMAVRLGRSRSQNLIYSIFKAYFDSEQYDRASQVIEHLRRQAGGLTLAIADRAIILSSLGIIEMTKKNPEKAIEYLQTGLDLYEKMGNTYWVSCIQHDLGVIYWNKGDLKQAEENFRVFLQKAHLSGRARDIIHGLYSMSNVFNENLRFPEIVELIKTNEEHLNTKPVNQLMSGLRYQEIFAHQALGHAPQSDQLTRTFIRLYKQFEKGNPDILMDIILARLNHLSKYGNDAQYLFHINRLLQVSEKLLMSQSASNKTRFKNKLASHALAATSRLRRLSDCLRHFRQVADASDSDNTHLEMGISFHQMLASLESNDFSGFFRLVEQTMDDAVDRFSCRKSIYLKETVIALVSCMENMELTERLEASIQKKKAFIAMDWASTDQEYFLSHPVLVSYR